MSTVNAPVQNVGLYPDAVNPIQKNPYSSSVAAFGRLMEPLLDPVAPVANTGPSSQTTHSDALREMFEFMSGNATFASPTVTPSLSTAVGTSSANSPSIDIQTGSDRKTNAGSQANGANGVGATEGALPKAQVAAVTEKKASPPTFLQSLRRSFSSRG